jgi:hypothetical protein
LYFRECADFGGGKRDMFVVEDDFEFLAADFVWFWPLGVVFIHDFGVCTDLLDGADYSVTEMDSFADDAGLVFAFVSGVVGVAQLTRRLQLVLQKLVPELPAVANAIVYIRIRSGSE